MQSNFFLEKCSMRLSKTLKIWSTLTYFSTLLFLSLNFILFSKFRIYFKEKFFALKLESFIKSMKWTAGIYYWEKSTKLRFSRKVSSYFKEFEVNLQSPWISVFWPLTFIVRFFSNFFSWQNIVGLSSVLYSFRCKQICHQKIWISQYFDII